MWKPYVNLPRTVHILCLGALVNRAGAFLAPFLTIYLQDELDLGIAFATSAMSIFGLGALIASWIGGDLADRIGRRTVMIISLFGATTVITVFAFLSTPWTILTSLFLFALISEMYRPAASAMIADVTEPRHRPQAYGLMYVAINLGFAVAAFVGGFIAQFSFKWLFFGDAATTAVYGAVICIAIRESLPTQRSRTKQTPDTPHPLPNVPTTTVIQAAKLILADKTFVLYCAGTFCLAVMYMQAFSTFPLHLLQHGIGPVTYGRIIALNGAMIVVLQLPITSVVTRRHRGTMVIASAVITSVGFGLTAVAETAWVFALTVAIWTVGEMMNSPLSSAIIADLAPVHLRARYMGVFSMCFSVAMIAGAPAGGFILQRFGGSCLWIAAAASGILAATLYASVYQKISIKPDNQQPTTES